MPRSRAVLLALALVLGSACQWVLDIGERSVLEARADAGNSDASGGADGASDSAGDATVACGLTLPAGPSVRAGHFIETNDRVRFCVTRSDGLELVLPSPAPGCPTALSYKQVSAPIALEHGNYSVKVIAEKDDCSDPPLAILDQVELGDASATLRYWPGPSLQVDSIDESDPVPDAIQLRFVHLMPGVPTLDFGIVDMTEFDTPITDLWFLDVPFGEVSRAMYGVSPLTKANANGYVEIPSKGARVGAGVDEKQALLVSWIDGAPTLGHVLSLYWVGEVNIEPLLCDESRLEGGLTWCRRGSEVELTGTTLAVGWEPAGDPTFNARRDALLAAFADERFTTDFVCLQELWAFQALAVALNNAVVNAYPYSSWYEANMTTPFSDDRDLSGATPAPLPPPCQDNAAEMSTLLACLRDECGNPGDDLSQVKALDCIYTSCGPDWQTVAAVPRCSGCVEVLLRGTSFGDAGSACSTLPNPLAFEGSSGTLLLSKHDIESESHFVIPSTYVRKDVVHARVRHAPSGLPVDVYCAYSPPVFELAEYHGVYGTLPNGIPQLGADGWSAEQQLFVENLRNFAIGFGSPVLVLGGLGVGPEHAPQVVGAHPELFDKLVGSVTLGQIAVSGYQPACTFCPDNSLLSPNRAPVWIDHALGNQRLKPVAIKRVFTEPEVGVLGIGAVPISQHYGLEVTVTTQP